MNPDLDYEDIWNKYSNLLKKLKDDNISKLLDEQGQRIIECSMSLTSSEPYCGVGGLALFSLELTKNARKISQAMDYNLSPASIIKVCLLSHIGAIGDLNVDRLIPCESKWHKEKLGQVYEWNKECQKYSIPHMTLFYLNHYGIKLTWEETLSILLSTGLYAEENKFYYKAIPQLAMLLQTAKENTLLKEKMIINGTYSLPF